MSFGVGELIVLGVVIITVFSAARMGAFGNAIGKFVYSFKKASKGEDMVDVTPKASGRMSKGPPPEDAQLVEDPKKKR